MYIQLSELKTNPASILTLQKPVRLLLHVMESGLAELCPRRMLQNRKD